MKFEIHRSPLELFCLTQCRSAQKKKSLNRESLGSNLSRGTSYITSLGRIIRWCVSQSLATQSTQTQHAHKHYTFGFFTVHYMFWQHILAISRQKKIEVQKETCYRRDLPFINNLLLTYEILLPKEEY
jgi:hypothetical protein